MLLQIALIFKFKHIVSLIFPFRHFAFYFYNFKSVFSCMKLSIIDVIVQLRSIKIEM